VLTTIDTLIVVGADPDATVREFCDAAGLACPPPCGHDKLPTGSALFWRIGTPAAEVIRTEPPKTERTRHSRKYTEGNLGRDRSFYFRGRDGKLKLKAHNLQLFLQIAEGVDDDTWLFHLHNGDYSRWLRTEVKDVALADEVEAIEGASPANSRDAIREAIEKRYTLPADKPSGVVDSTSSSNSISRSTPASGNAL